MTPEHLSSSAVVLAGGKSSRMGSDKRTLPWNGASLLEHIAAKLAAGFEDVIVVIGVQDDSSLSFRFPPAVRLVHDRTPFEGPLHGLWVGLQGAAGEVAFVCGCDQPFVSVAVAQTLCALCAGHDAAVPLFEGRRQVLHAAYRRSCLAPIEAMLAAGERRVQDLVARIDARLIVPDEFGPGFDPRCFFNINTVADYAAARRRAD